MSHEQLAVIFNQQFGANPLYRAFAPGRVNLIGDHTDYNQGLVLPMTIDRGVSWCLSPRRDRKINLYSLEFGETVQYSLDQPLEAGNRSWAIYVIGVINELRQHFEFHHGFDGVIMGDVPLGSGLSSSAALSVASVLAMQACYGFDLTGSQAAQLCQQVEHRYAGVQCGIMDQFVSRLGQANHALALDCRDLSHRHIALKLKEAVFVVVHSNVPRKLTDSAYNERRQQCQQAADALTLTSLRDASSEQITQQLENSDNPLLWQRARHVVSENHRVEQATQALETGDLERMGQMMNQSHQSLRDDYQVSCPELDLLAELSQETPGVYGARMTGAGFGGCTVHLVERSAVANLQNKLEQQYAAQTGLNPSLWIIEQNHQAQFGDCTDP